MDIKNFSVGGRLSLVALTGKEIEDIQGYISNEWGSPYFQISKIVFKDNSVAYVEGEHDCPYIPANNNHPNMDYDTLEALRKKEDDEEQD